MRVRGDLQPNNAFSIEEHPQKPGIVVARFYENVEPFTETKDNLTVSGFEYDEYHLELAQREGLTEDILNSFDGYLAQAKLQEAETKVIPDLQQKVADLETEKAALQKQVSEANAQITDTSRALHALLTGEG